MSVIDCHERQIDIDCHECAALFLDFLSCPVFVLLPYCFESCAVGLKSGSIIPPAVFFFLKIVLTI